VQAAVPVTMINAEAMIMAPADLRLLLEGFRISRKLI
jgi:hypothetical protein